MKVKNRTSRKETERGACRTYSKTRWCWCTCANKYRAQGPGGRRRVGSSCDVAPPTIKFTGSISLRADRVVKAAASHQTPGYLAPFNGAESLLLPRHPNTHTHTHWQANKHKGEKLCARPQRHSAGSPSVRGEIGGGVRGLLLPGDETSTNNPGPTSPTAVKRSLSIFSKIIGIIKRLVCCIFSAT